MEWTIFDRHSLLREPKGPRWILLETYNREPTMWFTSRDNAEQWLVERGFTLNDDGAWTRQEENQ